MVLNHQETIPLLNAVREGDLKEISDLLKNGADVNAANQDGNTALHLALDALCDFDTTGQIVRLLLDHGADLDLVNVHGHSPLCVAAARDDTATLRILVDAGARFDNNSDAMISIMFDVVRRGEVDTLELLHQSGADACVTFCGGHSPLLVAALCGQDKIVRSLLRRGACVYLTNHQGTTALMLACGKCSLATAQLLIDHGAHVNVMDNSRTSALMVAAQRSVDMVRVILDAKGNINQQNGFGETALFLACVKSSLDIVKTLVEAGANLDVPDEAGNTALCEVARRGHIDILSYLIQAGADVNVQNQQGRTALMLAASRGHHKEVICLVGAGAEVHHIDKHSTDTALTLICRHCHPQTISYFLESTTDGTFDINHINAIGENALSLACKYNYSDIVRSLIHRGADVNQRNLYRDGNSILHVACKNASVQIVRQLLEAGTSVNTENRSKLTPLALGVRRGNTDLIKLLLQNGAFISTELHMAVITGNKRVVQTLLQNGAVPTLQKCTDIKGVSKCKGSCYNVISPLWLAIMKKRFEIARYFIANWFFHHQDVSFTSRIQRSLEDHALQNGQHKILAFINHMYSCPWPLAVQSYVTVLTATASCPQRERTISQWEIIQTALKKRLLFQDDSVHLPIDKWSSIPFSLH